LLRQNLLQGEALPLLHSLCGHTPSLPASTTVGKGTSPHAETIGRLCPDATAFHRTESRGRERHRRAGHRPNERERMSQTALQYLAFGIPQENRINCSIECKDLLEDIS
jgi:hypothetical protein